MDVLDVALQTEKEGEAYYRQLAYRTSNTGLRTILNMLADEEVKHQRVLEQGGAAGPSAILTRAKNIFAEMEADQAILSDESSQVDLYRDALVLEERSRDFYAQTATEQADQNRAGLFEMLAREEAKHAMLIRGIVDFVSHPKIWLEDATFNHLDAE